MGPSPFHDQVNFFKLHAHRRARAGVIARVNNEERVSNAPLPCRKYSRESNMIVMRPKMVCYDIYTQIKIGIDCRGLLPPLPQCLQEILHSEASEKLSGAYGTAART